MMTCWFDNDAKLYQTCGTILDFCVLYIGYLRIVL